MIVDVKGHGKIKFPDSMSESEVKAVLKQFETPKDETIPKLLSTLEALLKQKPQIVTEQKIVEVEKQVVVKVPEVQKVEVEKVVEVVGEPVSWRFTVNKGDGSSYEVIADPI